MKFVVQYHEDGCWFELPGRFYSLELAIESIGTDPEAQIVAIPAGKVVWRSGDTS